MSLNKNKIFGYTALIIAILGTALILIGVLKYPEYAIGFSIAGVGFYAIAWAFNACRSGMQVAFCRSRLLRCWRAILPVRRSDTFLSFPMTFTACS